MDDPMCDPATYQLVQSHINTSPERADTHELCYSPDTTFRLPSEERRRSRMPIQGPAIFHMRTMRVSRSAGSKR